MKKQILTILTLALLQTSAVVGQAFWKHDINFVNSGQNDIHTFDGVIDNLDRSYVLQSRPGSTAVETVLCEFMPDGTSGFVLSLGSSVYYALPDGSYSGGIAEEGNIVYASRATHPQFGGGFTTIERIDKTTQNFFSAGSFATIIGHAQVTEILIKDGFMYVSGNCELSVPTLEFIDPVAGNNVTLPLSQNTGGNPVVTSFLAKYNLGTRELLWARRTANLRGVEVGGIEVDDQQRVYICGTAQDGAQFGTGAGSFTVSIPAGGAASHGVVARYDINLNFDPTFTPILWTDPATVAPSGDHIDDIAVDDAEGALYVIMNDRFERFGTNTNAGAPVPPSIWQSNIPNSAGFPTITLTDCDEIYVIGSVPSASQLGDYRLWGHSRTTPGTATVLSQPAVGYNGSDGELVLVQSDDDKVVIVDYRCNNLMAVDYQPPLIDPISNSVTYSSNSQNGTLCGIYDDGLTNDLVNSFFFMDAQSNQKLEFSCGEDVWFDGTASNNETAHFIGMRRRQTGVGAYQFYHHFGNSGWFPGQADVKNLSQLLDAETNGSKSFEEGYQYEIKLAVQNGCIGWMEQTIVIEIVPLDPNFGFTVSPISGTPYFNLYLNPEVTSTNFTHIWYLWNTSTNTPQVIAWPGVPNQVFLNVPNGTYNIVHIIQDPSGNCSQVSHYHSIGVFKNGVVEMTEKPTPLTAEMEEQTLDVESGTYDHLNIASGNSNSTTAEFELYPNPANQNTTIANLAPTAGNVSVLSLEGQLLMSTQIQPMQKQVLDITDLAAGMYFITLEYDNGQTATKRFVKQ